MNHIGARRWRELTPKQKKKIIENRASGRAIFQQIQADKRKLHMPKTTTTVVTTTTTTTTTSAAKTQYDAFILDRSGSMSGLRTSTINGFNEYINTSKSKALSTGIETFVSVLLFDHEFIDLNVFSPVSQVLPLTVESYQPRGNTALNDAIARTINALKARLKGRENSDDVDVTITIFTDGEENASKEFPGARNSAITAMIKDVQDRFKWTVTYVGAGTRESVQYVGSNLGMSASNISFYSHNALEATRQFRDLTDARSTKTESFSKGLKSNVGYFTNTDTKSVQTPVVDEPKQ